MGVVYFVSALLGGVVVFHIGAYVGARMAATRICTWMHANGYDQALIDYVKKSH